MSHPRPAARSLRGPNRRSAPASARRIAVRLAAVLAATAASLPAGSALAQRAEAKIAAGDRDATIGYGPVRLGKHSLTELPVGGSWRLGTGTASALETTGPLRAGDDVVAPGGYKLSVVRAGEKDFRLAVARAGFALGGADSLVYLRGSFAETEDSKGKLEIACEGATPGAGAAGAPREFEVRMRYGKYALAVPATLYGTAPAPPAASKVPGLGLDVRTFSLPADWVRDRAKKGKPTPIASLSRKSPKKNEPRSWNVILTGRDSVLLRPAQETPTANYGFGEFPDDDRDPEEDALERKGTVAWAPGEEQGASLAPLKAGAAAAGGIELVIACGGETMTLALPDPAREAKPAKR